MSRDIEHVNVLRTSTLNVNGRTIFSNEFPLGEGWLSMNLRVGIVVTIGTGSGAIAESELLFIKNVLLKTNRGETLCNLNGRALYKIAAVKSGALPRKDAMAAASATYYVDLPIYFADERMLVPTDTVLDTSRYTAITLDITLGTVADLFTTVGTSSVTATLDVDIKRYKGELPVQAKPDFHISYDTAPVVDAASATLINLPKSTDLAYKRLYIHECSSGTAGVPFSGANADDVKNLESVSDSLGFIFKQRVHEMIQNANKTDYGLESVLAGITVIDFVADGSINTALTTSRPKLDFEWSNKAGVASGDLVSIAFEGVRTLK